VSGWPATLFAAAERIARARLGEAPYAIQKLVPVAARLGLADDARRLAAELESAGGDWLADAAQVYAALGDRAAVDRTCAAARADAMPDPRGLQARSFAAAYQRLGEDTEADRIVGAIVDEDAQRAAYAVLTHDAVATDRPERAALLSRTLARALARSEPADGGTGAVLALVAGGTDRATAAETSPVAERAATAAGAEGRDEDITAVARLWLAAGAPAEALRLARPIALRARRDFNAAWYAELARVLVDAGDAEAGELLFEQHVRWYALERSAAASARAALALTRWGRSADAEAMIADEAEPRLQAVEDGSRADEVRRVLVEAYLALDEVAAAIQVASEFSAPDAQVRELLVIALHGGDGGAPASPPIAAALAATGLASAGGR
jgi:hypothetical protein